MSFQMKQLPLSIMQVIAGGAFAAFAIAPAMAQQASTDTQTTDSKVQRVEVTGSNIKRSDKATAENVQVVTAAQIKESGQTTVADFLHTLSANFASFHENDTNSFSAGASGIALRGLSQKNTLVLLNGQRITNYGFAQNLEDTYVDLNTIPVNAVDHIDVLKDGATSVYGSDAIAGVVNIVLKSNYQGKEADIQYGAANGNSMATTQSSITAGFGNLADDGYNVMVAASVFHRADLLASQRDMTASNDARNLPGGTLTWNSGDRYITDAHSSYPQAAFPGCGTNGYPGQVMSLSNFPTSAKGTTCAFNPSNSDSLIPGTDRANIVADGTLKINSNLTAFGDVFVAAVRTKAYLGSAAGLGKTSVVYDGATGSVSPVHNTLPAGNSSNILPPATPTSAGSNPDGSQDINYSFQSVGTQYYKVDSYTSRISGGLKGSINDNWDWQAVAGLSENNVGQTNFNSINVPALQAAIANNTYNFINPSLTPAGTAALRTQFEQASVAKLETLDAKVSGSLFDLPAGQVQSAFGYEFRHESEANTPDSKLLNGDILGYGATEVNGARSVNALFGEVEIPVLKSLISNIALREEKYSDFGSNLSPKLSLRWQPTDILTMRGSYTLGFRAPSLPEISHSSATSFQYVNDPKDPNKRPVEEISVVSVANPNLKAEKSKNLDFGFVLAPTKDLSFAVDFYRVSISDIVATDALPQDIVNANASNAALPAGTSISRTADGTVNYVTVPYANVYSLYTRGVDFDGKYVFKLAPGQKLTTDVNFTYVDHMDINTSPGGPLQNFAGSDGWLFLSPVGGGGPVPHLRGNASETWENHDWMVRGTVNFTSGYKETNCIYNGACNNASAGLTADNAAIIASNVHSYTSFDMFTQYTGFKNWTLSASVTNLFNKNPPWDAGQWVSGGGPVAPELYDLTGRFINFRAAYKF
jgi:iron complex outermembrane receptor protein